MWIVIVFATLTVMAVAGYSVSRGRCCKQMFSKANFQSFHKRLSDALEVAKRKENRSRPSVVDGSAFVTGAGLAIGVSFSCSESGNQALHISMSQPGEQTTHAVCSRFGFFASAMLRENQAELTPFFTESGVHHLMFRFRSPDVSVQEFNEAYSAYASGYKPVPFVYQKIGRTASPAENRYQRL